MKNTFFILMVFAMSKILYGNNTNDNLLVNQPSKTSIEVGLKTGLTWISGEDVVPLIGGLNIGLEGRLFKTISENTALGFQLGYNVATAVGMNYQPSSGHYVEDTRNRALTGGFYYDEFNDFGITPDYRELLFFQNYFSRIGSFYIGGILKFNISQKFELSLFSNVGTLGYITYMNALDEQGQEYNFDIFSYSNDVNEIYDQLFNTFDDTFESAAERHRSEGTNENGVHTNLIVEFGFSIQYNLGAKNKYLISLEHKNTTTRDDLLDGSRYSEWGSLTRNFDRVNWLKLGFAYRLKN